MIFLLEMTGFVNGLEVENKKEENKDDALVSVLNSGEVAEPLRK